MKRLLALALAVALAGPPAAASARSRHHHHHHGIRTHILPFFVGPMYPFRYYYRDPPDPAPPAAEGGSTGVWVPGHWYWIGMGRVWAPGHWESRTELEVPRLYRFSD